MINDKIQQLHTFVKLHCTALALAGSVAIASTTGLLALGCYSGTCKLADGRAATDTQVALIRFGGALAMGGLLLLAYNNRNSLTSEAIQKPATKDIPFDSSPLHELATNQHKHPHVFIVAKTGGGKSTLAQYLAAKCTGKRFAMAVHHDVTTDDWQCCHAVFGVGVNYGTPDDEPISYSALVSGEVDSPSTEQIMQAILTEMYDRYRSGVAHTSHEVHNWILDECPAVARAMDKRFGSALAPILFEARKVGLRMFVLSQSDNVETLKIKGQGKLRDQFTYIYAGDSASARLKQLKRRKPQLPEGARWCVVDETIALVPDIQEINKVVAEASLPDRFVARMPERKLEPPKASELQTREPYPHEWEALEIRANELLASNPQLTDNQLGLALGFQGRYQKRGKTIVQDLRKRLTAPTPD